jgi:hypothetical protein
MKTYFVLAKALNRVKIGKALDPEKRLGELQTGAPEELELLLYLPHRPPFEESQLHQRFKKYRVCGEWFEFRDDLKLFITDKIRDPQPTILDDESVAPKGRYAFYLKRDSQDRPKSSALTPTTSLGYGVNSFIIRSYDEETDEYRETEGIDRQIAQEWAAEKIN